VIKRLYVHNFRCLENFELNLEGRHSVLLIGNNGSGKSTVAFALQVFQSVGRGKNRVKDLVRRDDFSHDRIDVPIRFEIDLESGGQSFSYQLAFDLPAEFKDMRVHTEALSVDGKAVYARSGAEVIMAGQGSQGIPPSAVTFLIDWHLVALPILQEQSPNDPLFVFKSILSKILILRPIPALISGDSNTETLQPDDRGVKIGDWFAGLMADAPAAYSQVDRYLRSVMPDFHDIRNPLIGADARQLLVQFNNGGSSLIVSAKDLSDGEKCFLLCGLLLASNATYGPLICFWDEPDNYIGLVEAGRFVHALRQSFQKGGLFIATSHNPEAIRGFSNESMLLLTRKGHLEPTVCRSLETIQEEVAGDLVEAITRGELDF